MPKSHCRVSCVSLLLFPCVGGLSAGLLHVQSYLDGFCSDTAEV